MHPDQNKTFPLPPTAPPAPLPIQNEHSNYILNATRETRYLSKLENALNLQPEEIAHVISELSSGDISDERRGALLALLGIEKAGDDRNGGDENKDTKYSENR